MKIKLVVVFIALAVLLSGCTTYNATTKIDEIILEDALWIYSGGSFYSGSPNYIDLQRNGEFLSVIGNQYSHSYLVFSGTAPKELVDKAFRITNTPAVLNARDTDPGEKFLSGEEWINVGILINQNLKSSFRWGFTEELFDYPQEFQELVAELKSFSDSSAIDPDILALITVSEVDSDRALRIKNDPRKIYDFIEIEKANLDETPSLRNAILQISRLVPIKNEAELQKIKEYLNESRLQSVGRDFFITVSDRSYQVELLSASPDENSQFEFKPRLAQLPVSAPFSDAEIKIEKLAGKDSARLNYVASSPDTGVDEQSESFEISPQKFSELTELIEKNNFLSFNGRYIEDNLDDATTYILSVHYIPTGPGAEFAVAFEHTVTCYGECPAKIIEIMNKIKELWGKEILEVGV